MLRPMLFAGFIVIAGSAFAQDTPPPQPSTPPATEAPAAPAAPATTQDMGQRIQAEFPRRDTDHNGSLNQAEFTSWLGEMHPTMPTREGGPDRDAQISAAFTQADADHNGSVTAAELTAFATRPH